MAHTQTAVFTQPVRAHMGRAPVVVEPGTACADALSRIRAARASALLVAGADGVLAGIVTERDIVRRVAFSLAADAPIERAMTAPVATIGADDYLFRAVGLMRRRGLRHLPVVDAAGAAIGMFDLDVALALAAQRMVAQIDRLTEDESLDGLGRVKDAQVSIAEQLFADNVPPGEILALISHINIDLHKRVATNCLAAMAEAGSGPPPVTFALIVMGSAGRGESSIAADQDNGLILSDYADSEHDRIDAWFRDYAERLTQMLAAIGLPLCRGGVMAINPLWRKTVTQWREQVDYWLRHRAESIARLADIFFDFQPAFGDVSLAEALRDHVAARLPAAPRFLQLMHALQSDHEPAVNAFGRLRRPPWGEHKGELNLKYGASLPLVEAVRLLALRAGIRDTATRARLQALAERGTLQARDLDELGDALTEITRLALRQHIADFHAGRAPGYWLRVASLTAREKRRLSEALAAVRSLRAGLKAEFATGPF